MNLSTILLIALGMHKNIPRYCLILPGIHSCHFQIMEAPHVGPYCDTVAIISLSCVLIFGSGVKLIQLS